MEKSMKEFIKIVVYLSNHSQKEIYKTKLNKLIFYVQFLYYKRMGIRLIEEDFYYDYFGPVLKNLNELLIKLEGREVLELVRDNLGTKIEARIELDEMLYTTDEIEVMELVLSKFDFWTARQLSDYSHEEIFWSDDRRGEKIHIEEARRVRDLY
ncbi:MAG: Panacea domain-containing protein [Sarcina sp.]